ncbi:LysR substrate-binding domain-containing protein [Aliivibrio salmonicida]|uniref:LysR substrate-binding domain-containing protein n=1 Tax=Aliivibrio salmonicida TaxID=40269 RepID=UPI00406CBC87
MILIHQSDHFSIYALESVLPKLQIRLKALLKESSITVTLKELPSNEEEILDALILEKVDLVLDVMKPRLSSLRSMVVSEDKICCIARCDHPRIIGNITRDMFFEEEHAFLNIRRFKQTITDYLAEEVLPNRKMGSEHTSMMGMMACVAQSDFIGINSIRLISQYKDSFGLQLLDVPFSVRSTKIHMLWPTKFENNKANQWLRQLIIAAEQV